MTALFRRIGLFNRYGELQVINLMLVAVFIKAWINPYLELSLFFLVTIFLAALKWYHDSKLRRGIWAELTKLEEQQKMVQDITNNLVITSEEMKIRISEVSNKIQFMK